MKSIEAQEQLETEEKSREADERMRIMLDATPIAAHFWDENYNLVDCNKEALRLFKMRDKQEYIDRYFDLTPELQPDGTRSASKLRQAIVNTFKAGYQRMEFMRQSLELEPIPVEITFVPVNYKGKKLVASYCRDLREHKQILGELEEATKRLEAALLDAHNAVLTAELAQSTTTAMFSSNPQVNVLFDSKFNAVECNPATLAFTGFSTKEEALSGFLSFITTNMPAFQSTGKPSASIGEKLVDASILGQVKFDTEIEVGGNNLSLVVEFIRIPYENSYGVVAYVFDMTEAHEREQELARERILNQRQLTKLDLVLRVSNIGLWEMDVVQHDPTNPENAFIFSDKFRHILGFSDATDFPDVLGSWINRLHPDDKKRTLEAFSRHMMDRTGQTPYQVEYRLRRKGGDYAYISASGETIRDESGNPLRVAGTLVDITESKNALHYTEKLRREAEAANQAKSTFLSTMSHEIRTPMNAILGITEMQLLKDALDTDTRTGLEQIYTAGDMLLGIINDILDLSKIEAGKLELIIEKYDTASLIVDTAQLNMMRIGSKRIEFKLNVDEKLPVHLVGDELRVKQILNNLLSNAFKYTKDGKVVLSVSLDKGSAGDRASGGAGGSRTAPTGGGAGGKLGDAIIVFRISDTGQGMTKSEVERLFDEYSQFGQQTNRMTEGTGLGMSITRNLIQMMGGDISVESERGKGTTFTVRLPQGRVDNKALGKKVTENLGNFRKVRSGRMNRVQITREPMPYGKVLVVDDVESNIFVAKGLIAPYEMQFDSADSGFAAIDKIEAGNEYDIIFMDHMMPKMDGVEATRRIRELGYKKPIVALTANAVAGQADMFLKNGFDDFISKPVDIRRLNTTLNKFVRDRVGNGRMISAPTKGIADQAQSDVNGAGLKGIAGQARNDVSESPPSQFRDLTIDGLDVAKGLERFYGDEDAYLSILRSYAKSVRGMLTTIENGEIGPSDTYRITVHGIKGASYDVFAENVAKMAAELEDAAKAGDSEHIRGHTLAFLETAWSLVASIDDVISAIDSKVQKPEKDRLDRELLAKLHAACDNFDMGAVEAIMEEINSFKYGSDRELALWLSENAELANFLGIVDKLKDVIGQYV